MRLQRSYRPSPVARRKRLMVQVSAALLLLAAACSDWRVDRPFDRAAGDVDTASADLNANQVASAKKRLFAFLGHGACVDGKVDLPEATRNSREARYDLALALADLGTAFGGKAKNAETTSAQEGNAEGNSNDLACAADMAEQLELGEPDVKRRLVLRALLGNIRLAEHKEQAAIDAFDAVLREIANPSTSFVATEAAAKSNATKSDAAVSQVDGGTHALPKRAEDIDLKQLADDVAFNRALALRALNKDKDGGADGGDDSSPDARSDGERPDADNPDGQGQDGASEDGQTEDAPQGDAQNPDAQNADAQAQGDGSPQDADSRESRDAGASDGSQDSSPPSVERDAGANDASDGAPPLSQEDAGDGGKHGMDDRILEQFERAPMFQEEAAKKRRKRVRPSEDK
jgi:hypothetical protein